MTQPLRVPLALPEPLQSSARWTEQRLARLRELLHAQAHALEGLTCVAAAGSLGRGEAGPASDVDCVVVGTDHACAETLERAMTVVLASVTEAGLRAPRPGGFFRKVVRVGELLDPQRLGRLDESPQVYGKRLQCLLDTQALTDSEALRTLRGRILRWFTLGQAAATPLALLASELVRYRRSYVAYQHYALSHGDGDSWRLRTVKLHSSRLVTVAGLLALVGEASGDRDPVAFVEAHLTLSPLERLLQVMHRWDPAAAERLAHTYTIPHKAVNDSKARGRLLDAPPVGLGDLSAPRSALIDPALDAALTELATQINAFFLAQQGRWANDFYRALLL